MIPKPATDIYTVEEHAQLNEIAENLNHVDHVDYSNCGNKPKPATDILTDEEHKQLDELFSFLPEEQKYVPNEEINRITEEIQENDEKKRELSDNDLTNMMEAIKHQSDDPEHQAKMKKNHDKLCYNSIFVFIATGIISILAPIFIYWNIKQHRNIKLDIILYVAVFILLHLLTFKTPTLTQKKQVKALKKVILNVN